MLKAYLEGDCARLHVPHETHAVELRAPHLHLSLPVVGGGQGADDKARPVLLERPLQQDAPDEGDRLDGLAQAHLVREDDVRVGPPAFFSSFYEETIVEYQKRWGGGGGNVTDCR